MSWGQNGITNLRHAVDQTVNVTGWGGSALRLATRSINQVGYLREYGFRLKPYAQTQTLAAAGNTLALGTGAHSQYIPYRAVQSINLTAQGIAAIYQLSKGGLDLVPLQYMRNGRKSNHKSGLGVISTNPSSHATYPTAGESLTSLGRTASHFENFAYWAEADTTAGTASTTQRIGLAGMFDLPLTEWVVFPGGTMTDSAGKTVTIPQQEIEVGLLSMQNVQQNIIPQVTLNPLFNVTGGTWDGVFQATTAIPSTTASPSIDFYAEWYDVPNSLADQPPAFAFDFIVSRTTNDVAVSGGAATYTFQPAGLLMRAAYVLYDANDQIVPWEVGIIPDVQSSVTIGTEPHIQFLWGASVYKYDEDLGYGQRRMLDQYGEPAPAGVYVHDFFTDHTTTELINTAQLTSVRAKFTNLPTANITYKSITYTAPFTIHTIEERMIPVRGG